ncbi:tetratricopeptide repeat protein [Novipirellula artificiosorum]|uniref:Uncharacterized protein n=1 Tax=Novipirellula artificiosorum TaxID=2528016 RepID=A0A5C6DT63_9BACT|nr:tetratricopeptide repeat protein [Novipirellula artificiosorum]TWU38216.1 hypothetical protein Poly41_26920 [Novipirellula artificiosorum]
MKSRIFIALLLALVIASLAQANETDSDAATPVELEWGQHSWFTDIVATAWVRFPERVEQPDELPNELLDGGDDISLLSVEVASDKGATTNGSVAAIRFIPRHTGLVVFPSLVFVSGSNRFQTSATQIMVSQPQRSSEMTFELTPEKSVVYVAQPLRVDVTWASQLSTNQIRSLRCLPEFFNDSSIETLVPRATAPEKEQMGLPFGGRRIIAKRVAPTDSPEQLGVVNFSLFLRFSKAGTVSLSATRLECAYLKGDGSDFSPYAAYFNNGLFEPMSSLTAYDRIFTESQPLTLDVLPLPTEGRSENFSGLFAPCDIDVTLRTNDIEVGQVMEVDLRMRSNAPHGMLELPAMNRQQSLRGRFSGASELGRRWYPDGTGFRARVRPLTTKVTAFPSLQIQLFDPDLRSYRFLQTSTIPLHVRPRDGRQYFDIRSLHSEATLTDQPTGIWHNREPNWMNDTFNMLIGLLAEYFWALILSGPILFASLLPWVKERRKRSVDDRYRACADAYYQLRKQPDGTRDKWNAFQHFLAISFSVPPDAWTSGDAERCLHSLGIPEDEIRLILDTHMLSDAARYSSEKPAPKFPNLDSVSRRLFDRLRRTTPLLVMALALSPAELRASDWSDAQSLFDTAIESPAGFPETESLYRQSALKFEASAQQRHRIGESWYNAGNAWFQSGELGRAIRCYRQAEIYRPFDGEIEQNLRAARALTLDVVEPDSSLHISSLPIRWICAAIAITSLLFWGLLLAHLRYRNRLSLAASLLSLVATWTLLLVWFIANHHAGKEGVVIVSEIYGRKGPSYHYSTAFHEPLHNGLEFHITKRRSDWLLVELADGRKCWIPSSEARVIHNSRL